MSGKEAYEEYAAAPAGGRQAARRGRQGRQGGHRSSAAWYRRSDPVLHRVRRLPLLRRPARFLEGGQEGGANGKRLDAGYVRPLEDYDKMPVGKGWVIEVSGYTFHAGLEDFISRTLLHQHRPPGHEGVAAPPPSTTPPGKSAADKPGCRQAARRQRAPRGKRLPPAGPPPSRRPPAPKPPAGGAAGGDGTGIDLFDSTKEPVVNRVSHVALYDSLTKQTTDAYRRVREDRQGCSRQHPRRHRQRRIGKGRRRCTKRIRGGHGHRRSCRRCGRWRRQRWPRPHGARPRFLEIAQHPRRWREFP